MPVFWLFLRIFPKQLRFWLTGLVCLPDMWFADCSAQTIGLRIVAPDHLTNYLIAIKQLIHNQVFNNQLINQLIDSY